MNFPYVNVKFVGNDGNYYMERITKVKFIWKWKDGVKKVHTDKRTNERQQEDRNKKDNAREVRVSQREKNTTNSIGAHRFPNKNDRRTERRKRSTMSGVTLYHLRQVKYWHNFSSIILNAAKKDTRPVCSHTRTQGGEKKVNAEVQWLYVSDLMLTGIPVLYLCTSIFLHAGRLSPRLCSSRASLPPISANSFFSCHFFLSLISFHL